MSVLLVKPGEPAKRCTFDSMCSTFHSLPKEYLRITEIKDGLYMVGSGSGKRNRVLTHVGKDPSVIRGTFVVCGYDTKTATFSDLSIEALVQANRLFGSPDMFRDEKDGSSVIHNTGEDCRKFLITENNPVCKQDRLAIPDLCEER